MRVGKVFTLFISNKNVNDISKTINALEYSSILLDRVTKTVKHEKEKCLLH